MLRSTRGHNAHGFCRGLGDGAGPLIRACRLSAVPADRQNVPTMVGMAILTRLKHTPRHSLSLPALSVSEGAVKAA